MELRRNVLIKKSFISPEAGTAADEKTPPGAHAPKESHGQPQVILHKNGEDIDAIEVICPCGHSLILECEYKS